MVSSVGHVLTGWKRGRSVFRTPRRALRRTKMASIESVTIFCDLECVAELLRTPDSTVGPGVLVVSVSRQGTLLRTMRGEVGSLPHAVMI